MEPVGERVGHKKEQSLGILALGVGPGTGVPPKVKDHGWAELELRQ